LREKVARLEERVAGIVPLQGARHILWDELIAEVASFIRYFIMIDEQE